MEGKYEDRFNDSEFDTIERKVKVYIKKGYFAQRDREDLIQECCMHWFSRRGQYQAGKASLNTFMERVLDNKLCDLAKREQTDKRKVNRSALSLDEELQHGDEADNRTRADKVTRDPWKGPRDAFSQADRALAVAEVLKKLTPAQRELCRLFMEGCSVSEASVLLSRPRSTIYDEISRIRELFEKAGLRDYLS